MQRLLTALVWLPKRFPASSVILAGVLAAGLVSGGPVASEPRQKAGETKAVKAGVSETLPVPPPLLALAQVKADPVGHHVSIVGPSEVPVGGLCIVTVEGLKADDSLSWVAVPSVQIADLIDRSGRPVLLVPTNSPGVFHLVLAFTDGGKVGQKTHTVKVGQPGPTPTPEPTPPGPTPPTPNPPAPVPPDSKATATYFYEKDQHAVTAAVMSALNKLNRERKIVATVYEVDTVDGSGQVPEQYKVGLAAAKEAGLPALVVTGPKGVLKVVKSPTTEQHVLEAAP